MERIKKTRRSSSATNNRIAKAVSEKLGMDILECIKATDMITTMIANEIASLEDGKSLSVGNIGTFRLSVSDPVRVSVGTAEKVVQRRVFFSSAIGIKRAFKGK